MKVFAKKQFKTFKTVFANVGVFSDVMLALRIYC
jgi:hypothetical protein